MSLTYHDNRFFWNHSRAIGLSDFLVRVEYGIERLQFILYLLLIVRSCTMCNYKFTLIDTKLSVTLSQISMPRGPI